MPIILLWKKEKLIITKLIIKEKARKEIKKQGITSAPKPQ